jgi:uncharacterized membrane protein YedE/YeeE
MPAVISALASGLLFGLGLTVSQMINPAKVIGFLEVLGDWDPSLAFVMAAAVPVAALGFVLGSKRAEPFCGYRFNLPTQTTLDGSLVVGAIFFGIGWGLVGYCPGPALAALSAGGSRTVLFVVSMLIGMGAHSSWRAFVASRSAARSDHQHRGHGRDFRRLSGGGI